VYLDVNPSSKNMEKLEKVLLGNKADEFILENLWAARSIENELKEFFLKSNRTVWTMLPKGLDEKTITGFPWGYDHKDHPSFENHIQTRLEFINSDDRFEWISFNNEEHVDEDIKSFPASNLTKNFFYNETIFQWLPKELVDMENLDKVIRSVGWYPTFGIVTILTDQIKENIFGNKVTTEDVKYIISNIKFMFMGAYDEEGSLIIEIN
jgi:hypothetical protein